MTTAPEATYLVTACPDHGTKEAADLKSMLVYVDAARADDHGWVWQGTTVIRTQAALAHDAAMGTDPWRCCWHMVIDPYGVFDH